MPRWGGPLESWSQVRERLLRTRGIAVERAGWVALRPDANGVTIQAGENRGRITLGAEIGPASTTSAEDVLRAAATLMVSRVAVNKAKLVSQADVPAGTTTVELDQLVAELARDVLIMRRALASKRSAAIIYDE